jgi:hypothetical protein
MQWLEKLEEGILRPMETATEDEKRYAVCLVGWLGSEIGGKDGNQLREKGDGGLWSWNKVRWNVIPFYTCLFSFCVFLLLESMR